MKRCCKHNSQDRVGSRIHLDLHVYAYCYLNNFEYIGTIYKNEIFNAYAQICNAHVLLNNLLSIPCPKIESKEHDHIAFDESILEKMNYNRNLYPDRNINELITPKFIRNIQNNFIYEKNNKISIVVHIRRGDVIPNMNPPRYLKNSYYIDILKILISYISYNYEIIILSETETYESFEDFKIFKNITFDLDKEHFYNYKKMINADILILSNSSYSFVPSLFNKGIVIYNPCWISYPDTYLNSSDVSFNDILMKKLRNLLNYEQNNMNKIAIKLTIRNEDDYLDEWFQYYISLGFKNYIIYDDESNDNTTNILNFYKNLVNIDINIINTLLCKHLDNHFKYKQYDYILNIDIDEFLYISNDINLVDYLYSKRNCSNIIIPVVEFANPNNFNITILDLELCKYNYYDNTIFSNEGIFKKHFFDPNNSIHCNGHESTPINNTLSYDINTIFNINKTKNILDNSKILILHFKIRNLYANNKNIEKYRKFDSSIKNINLYRYNNDSCKNVLKLYTIENNFFIEMCSKNIKVFYNKFGFLIVRNFISKKNINEILLQKQKYFKKKMLKINLINLLNINNNNFKKKYNYLYNKYSKEYLECIKQCNNFPYVSNITNINNGPLAKCLIFSNINKIINILDIKYNNININSNLDQVNSNLDQVNSNLLSNINMYLPLINGIINLPKNHYNDINLSLYMEEGDLLFLSPDLIFKLCNENKWSYNIKYL